MGSLELVLIARLRIDLAATWEVGEIPGGYRRIIPIVGGNVSGPRLTGAVLPVGADWNFRRADGGGSLTAHYAIQTKDGTVISVQNDAQFMVPESWPLITRPVLEAPYGEYEWLNTAVLVGTLRPGSAPSAVELEFFEAIASGIDRERPA